MLSQQTKHNICGKRWWEC